MGSEQDEVLVGREYAAVPDPLNRYRAILGEHHARTIDDAATVIGEELAEYSDGSLSAYATELGSPLDDVDPNRAAKERRMEREYAATVDGFYSAKEDELAHVGTARALDSPPLRRRAKALGEMALAARNRFLDSLDLGWVVAHGRENIRIPSASRYMDMYRAMSDWSEAAKWVAAAREQAIRQALHDQDPADARASAAEVKQIGTGGLAGVLEAEDAAEARARDGLVAAAHRVQRNAVSPPSALESLRDVIGERRVDVLAASAKPLAEWLGDNMPDDWIRARHAQLGVPVDSLDRDAARETLRLERALEAALNTRTEARGEAIAFATVDPERAAVAQRTADKAQASVEEVMAGIDHLYSERRHLDLLMVGDDLHLTRAVAYADARERCRHVEIAEVVEASVLDPPAHVTDLIGAAPKLDAPERLEWEEITRVVEGDRAARESARQEGTKEPPMREREDERQLAERIDRFREEQGMEPLPEVSGREEGLEMG